MVRHELKPVMRKVLENRWVEPYPDVSTGGSTLAPRKGQAAEISIAKEQIGVIE